MLSEIGQDGLADEVLRHQARIDAGRCGAAAQGRCLGLGWALSHHNEERAMPEDRADPGGLSRRTFIAAAAAPSPERITFQS